MNDIYLHLLYTYVHIQFTENQYQLRAREGHTRHCQLVENDKTLSTTYGVKGSSLLNQSRFFHVIDGLDLDVMHDQLEGVLPLEIKLLLQKFISVEKFFTLDILNTRIATFGYPVVDTSNKPSAIKQQALSSDSASLSQSGMFNTCISDNICERSFIQCWSDFVCGINFHNKCFNIHNCFNNIKILKNLENLTAKGWLTL